jgi:hypothetical protein
MLGAATMIERGFATDREDRVVFLETLHENATGILDPRFIQDDETLRVECSTADGALTSIGGVVLGLPTPRIAFADSKVYPIVAGRAFTGKND